MRRIKATAEIKALKNIIRKQNQDKKSKQRKKG